MEVVQIAIDRLRPNPWNVNRMSVTMAKKLAALEMSVPATKSVWRVLSIRKKYESDEAFCAILSSSSFAFPAQKVWFDFLTFARGSCG